MQIQERQTAYGNVPLIEAKDWQAPWGELQPHVLKHPTMLSVDELRMLRWLTAEYYSGAGCICDLGSFLGGSTMALADGYLAAGHKGPRIHTYDRHLITRKAWDRYKLAARHPFPQDGNFLEFFKTLLENQLAALTIHSGDFLAQPAPDEDIEILFIDIAKSVATHDHILTQYFPRLIPGKSIVVQQDYFYPWPVWDIASMEVLKDHFKILAQAGPNSAIFLYTKPFTPEAISRALASNLSHADMQNSLLAAARRWPFQNQRIAIYRAYQLLELVDGEPLAEVKEPLAKMALDAVPVDRAKFRQLVG